MPVLISLSDMAAYRTKVVAHDGVTCIMVNPHLIAGVAPIKLLHINELSERNK